MELMGQMITGLIRSIVNVGGIIVKRFNVLVKVLVVISILFAGCGRNAADCIAIVREGHFNMNPSIKIGNAFDQYFKNGEWKAFKAADKADVVEFTGEFAWDLDQQKAKIYMQFILNENEQGNMIFNVQRMDINGITVDNETLTFMISKILSGYRPVK